MKSYKYIYYGLSDVKKELYVICELTSNRIIHTKLYFPFLFSHIGL